MEVLLDERHARKRKKHFICIARQQNDGPFSLKKTNTSCVSLTPEVGVFDDPMELLRHA